MRHLILASLLFLSTALQAEKKPLDHDVYDSWESISAIKLTKDGSAAFYTIKPQEGDSRTVFRNTASGAELVVERAGTVTVTEDCTKAVFLINPHFATTRQAKIDKKKPEEMPADTLAMVDLKTLTLHKIGIAKNFKTGLTAAPYIFAGLKGDSLLVYNTTTYAKDTLKAVNSYAVSKDGLKLAYTSAKDKKDSLSQTAVTLYDFVKDSSYVLNTQAESYTTPVFSDKGTRLAFLATSQVEKTDGTPNHSLFVTEEVVKVPGTRKRPAITEYETSELVSADTTAKAWVIGKNAGLKFSNSGERIFLKLHKYVPAKDTTLVDFETAKLDIWVWNKSTVPPMDKVSKNPRTLTACVNLDDNQLIILSANEYETVKVPSDGDGDYAIVSDTKPYILDNLWAQEAMEDYYLVNLHDGSRKLIIEGSKGYGGSSPYGKYILTFDSSTGDWINYDIATGQKYNLTAGRGVNFYNEDDDHPICLQPIENPTFVGKDEAIIIVDKYDVWKFSPDGTKVTLLTKGYGRENHIQFRPTRLSTKTNPYLYFVDNNYPTKGQLYLKAYNDYDSRNGFYSVDIAKGSSPSGFLAENAFNGITKAIDAPTVLFTKGDFQNPYDVYQSSLAKGINDCFDNSLKLTDINPQQENYIWGDVELVRWNAYDGTPLRGLLFTPENLDPAKKYPMMIYFYEKYSESLYNYRSPAPSASTVNIPFFVSRGYVVFIPDIVYVDGHPGESAYNCICAGAEAMCEKFSFIDPERMAIQGQSWGGYQTAYLVGRTNMFAAAGAGAPVSNMTSAYGGIRWESGNSRISQYEYGQSRIGKKLWEPGGLELYVENSPVFNSPKVETPLLIMHNDADGAVPWYQGIEYFMSLRRLGKPVWLLQYNNEEHNLMKRENRKDLSIRLSQFFDYYLLGAPKPVWMESGIPYERKGQYLATELID